MKWLAGIFVLFIAFIIFEANRGQMPSIIRHLYDFPGGDLVGHFILMGTLTFLIDGAFAWGRDAARPKDVIIVTAVIAFLVTVEEFSQRFFPNRTFSLLDLSFSYMGIISAGCLAYFLAKRKSLKRPA